MDIDEVHTRVTRLEARVKGVEREQQTQREFYQLFSMTVTGLQESMREVRSLILKHLEDEVRDRNRLLISVVTAAISAVGALIVGAIQFFFG